MPVDPLVSLAFSIHSNKGVYALLLGSGVSRSAGVPTGWDVVIDLIKKMAAIQGEKPDPTPEQWYKEKYCQDPDYADILERITKTQAERTQLLRSYFEPSEIERDQGLKRPTQAHQSIAQLMRAGYVRIVITTNFDRLLEQALRDAGVEPSVISTPDAIRGMAPLTHACATIIKLHGDYLDHRLKNTPKELSAYEDATNELLDRVLDDFGLIVCGWSGQYDAALRSAIERCSNRRYPTYWAARGGISDAADRLMKLRAGTIIPIKEADEFFSGVCDSVLALERFQGQDLISQKVAVARVKQYLSKPDHRIDFHDLLSAETERVVEAMRAPEFAVQGSDVPPEMLLNRLTSYEKCCDLLLAVVATSAYWSRPEHYSAIISCLRRLLEFPEPIGGSTVLINLRFYPALLVFYVLSVSAIAAENEKLVAEVFSARVRLKGRNGSSGSIVSLFHQHEVLSHDAGKLLPGRAKQFTPLSNHLHERLSTCLRDHIPSDVVYDDAFDWFEYLVGLFYSYEHHSVWGPVGRFGWTRRNDSEWMSGDASEEPGLSRRLVKLYQGMSPQNGSKPLSNLILAKNKFDRFISEVCRFWH